MIRLTPTHRRTAYGEMYVDEYTVDSVDLDAIESNMAPDGAELGVVDGDSHWWYSYESQPAIFIDSNGAYTDIETDIRKKERQAYFALSILDSEGVTSGFSKI